METRRSYRERAQALVTPSTAVASAAILVYVLLASRELRLPGIYADELINFLPAQAFVHGGIPPGAVEGTGPTLTIHGHSMTIMTVPYLGSLKSAIATPLVALFGVTPTLVRLFGIGAGVLALAATFVFTRRLFRDAWIAATALILLALDPSFFFYSRDDWGPTDLMLVEKAFAGWLLLRWWDTGNRWSLALGTFVLGVGLWDKFNFAWIIASGVLALAVMAGRPLLKRLDWRTVLVAASGFVAGALPLIVYNLRSHFGTLSAAGNLGNSVPGLATSAYPFDEPKVPGGGLVSQVIERMQVLWRLLDGTEVSRLLGTSLPAHFWVLPLFVVAAAIAVCAQAFIPSRTSREARVGLFLVLWALGTVVATAVTGSAFHGHHVILVYPLPHIVLALAIVQAGRYAAQLLKDRRPALATSLVLVACVPVILAGITTVGLLHTMRETDGRGLWSSSIYDLERFITRAHGGGQNVAVDWGLAPPLIGLSEQKLLVADDWGPLGSLGTARRALSRPLRDPRTWYILHSRQSTVEAAAREHFFRVVHEAGARPVLVREFRGREGKIVYEIYSVAPGRQGRA